MTNLFAKHIELVEAVNNSKRELEHNAARQRLDGFRDALDICGIKQLIDCDNYYLEQGIDRPMCCGIFLDWQPYDVEE